MLSLCVFLRFLSLPFFFPSFALPEKRQWLFLDNRLDRCVCMSASSHFLNECRDRQRIAFAPIASRIHQDAVRATLFQNVRRPCRYALSRRIQGHPAPATAIFRETHGVLFHVI